MNKINLDKVFELKKEISDFYQTVTTESNTVTTDTYNILNNVSNRVSTITNKVSVLGDMITDLRVLNGTAKTVQYLSELDIVENNGLRINNDKFELDNLNIVNKEINSKLSSISSLENYKLKDVNGKVAYLEDFIKTSSEVIVEFPNMNYNFTLNLQYNNVEQINTIELQLGLTTESYPLINSIKYIDSNNNLKDVVILNTNSKNMDLDEDRVLNNLYTLTITPIVTNQILIEFSSRDQSSISFKHIKTSYRTSIDEGYVILGPIYSEDPILKTAINSEEITEGVTFEISTDKEYWIPISNTSSIIKNGDKKILSFNTINTDSFKTDEDIYSFYVKISIVSKEITNNDVSISIYNTLREDNTLSNDTLSLIENNLFSAYRVKNSDFIYGRYLYTNSLNTAKLNLDKIEYLESDGVLKVLGLVSSKYSITNSNTEGIPLGSIGAELKLKRLDADKIIDASKFDVANSVIYDIYPRYIESTINTKQKDNLCFLLKKNIAEDVYTITGKISKKSLQLDLTTPFIFNSAATLINVANEDIIIKNSIGELISVILKEDLLTITENEVKYYFLNLTNILFDSIEVEGYTYSKLYPLKELDNNEYGLLNGKIITGKDVIVAIKGFELLKSVVNINKIVNYTNGNYIKRLDDDFTYHHEQIEDNSTTKTIIKLESVSIEKGSLVLEEYFGEGESYSSTPIDTRKFINVNTETEPKYIIVDADNPEECLQE